MIPPIDLVALAVVLALAALFLLALMVVVIVTQGLRDKDADR